jgi:hypothetical protein
MRAGARAGAALLLVANAALVFGLDAGTGRGHDVINQKTNTLHGVNGERLSMSNGQFKNKRAKTASFKNLVVGTHGNVYDTNNSVYPLVWKHTGKEPWWYAVVAILIYILYQLTFVQAIHLQRIALVDQNVYRKLAWFCVKCTCTEKGVFQLGVAMLFLAPIILVGAALYYAPYCVLSPYAAVIFFFIYLTGRRINVGEAGHNCTTDFPALMAMAGFMVLAHITATYAGAFDELAPKAPHGRRLLYDEFELRHDPLPVLDKLLVDYGFVAYVTVVGVFIVGLSIMKYWNNDTSRDFTARYVDDLKLVRVHLTAGTISGLLGGLNIVLTIIVIAYCNALHNAKHHLYESGTLWGLCIGTAVTYLMYVYLVSEALPYCHATVFMQIQQVVQQTFQLLGMLFLSKAYEKLGAMAAFVFVLSLLLAWGACLALTFTKCAAMIKEPEAEPILPSVVDEE